MTSSRRELPTSPNLDHLRKQAKTRLADMRLRSPGVRLGEAQLILAREYGFPNWGALQAEVVRRAGSPAGAWPRIRRAPAGMFPFWRMPEPERDEPVPGFLRASAVMPLGVLLALVGLGVVLFAIHQGLPFSRPLAQHHRAS